MLNFTSIMASSLAETAYKVLAASEETVVDQVTIAIDENAVCHLSLDDEVADNKGWLCSIILSLLWQAENLKG